VSDNNFHKRRRMFIEPQEQTVFMVRAWLYCLIFAGAVMIPIYRPGPQWQLSDAQRATNQFLFYHLDKWPWFILPFIAVGLVSVIGSHRIFGPVVGLKNTLKRVMNHDLTVKFSGRPGDHFEELAVLVNQVVAKNRDEIRTIKNLAVQAKSDLAAGRTTEAQSQMNRLIDELEKFRLDSPQDG